MSKRDTKKDTKSSKDDKKDSEVVKKEPELSAKNEQILKKNITDFKQTGTYTMPDCIKNEFNPIFKKLKNEIDCLMESNVYNEKAFELYKVYYAIIAIACDQFQDLLVIISPHLKKMFRKLYKIDEVISDTDTDERNDENDDSSDDEKKTEKKDEKKDEK